MAWIVPDRFDYSFHTPTYNEGSILSTLSCPSTKSSRSGRKWMYITDKGMEPKKGKLLDQLKNNLGQFPQSPKKDRNHTSLMCQLHSWLQNERKESGVVYCLIFNINICAKKCFFSFIMNGTLQQIKKKLHIHPFWYVNF